MLVFLSKAPRWIALAFLAVVLFSAGLWAFGALWYDANGRQGSPLLAAGFAALFLALPILLRRCRFWRFAAVAFLWCMVLAWWLTLRPRQDRVWQPDVSKLACADVDGDQVVLHN